MSHVDPDLLALRALGESLPDDQELHLQQCEVCRGELEPLRSVVALGRSGGPHHLTPPPDEVWDTIVAGTGRAVPPPATVWDGIAAETSGEVSARTSYAGGRARQRRPLAMLAAAGVAGIAAGAAGVVALQAFDQEPAERTVAVAELDPLSGTFTGTARVVEGADGRQLTVELEAPAPDAGYYEAWLLTDDAQGLVSVGPLRAGETTLDLPDGLELSEFPVVDVSAEAFDGNPAHSGDSLVRGRLDITS